jgi:3-oxoadipate enol-lactonase
VSTPPDQLRALAQGISGARMVELEAAHLSNVERPGEFTQALVSFLSHTT